MKVERKDLGSESVTEEGFKDFAARINKRFKRLSEGELFLVGTSDGMFDAYLAAYPEGTDPVYKTRRAADCSTCKSFVRHLGRVVRLKGAEVETVWDVEGLEYPFAEVAAAMGRYVRGQEIVSVFRTKERSYGSELTRQLLDGGAVKRWSHLYGQVAPRHLADNPDEIKGSFNTTVQVFQRGLEEIKPDALRQIVDLIEGNSLYRGEEHLTAVRGFAATQRTYATLPDPIAKSVFVWAESGNPAARFRNGVIGTLAQDLSEGVELEAAVRSFETKVAPTNYKRTTALITPRMVEDAMKTIHELDLEPALQRRLAHIGDVSVNNVLWVDRSVRGKMKGGIEELLMGATTASLPSSAKATDVGIDYFMAEVLPNAQSMELHVRNTHLSNFVTLTAPVNPDTGRLFRWSNDFAWSYDGNITDSIREKVKAAGGNVEAALRFSLAWYNHDDLDIHVIEPSGNHIYYGAKRGTSGYLDVDMNVSPTTRQPVENVSFAHPKDGIYRVYVNQFTRRETTDVGFSIEIASLGNVDQLSYPKGISPKKDVPVGTFKVAGGKIVEASYGPDIVGNGISQSKWGLRTEGPVKVETVMYSPNFWDDNAVGNKHVFFMLEGCRVEEPMRGIYNEFLASGLEKHRKVFEVLGDKTKCPVTDRQLSGLGFSSTRGDSVTVSVRSERGARLYNVKF